MKYRIGPRSKDVGGISDTFFTNGMEKSVRGGASAKLLLSLLSLRIGVDKEGSTDHPPMYARGRI